jgi:tetratricopeptide (TPR) repeat protein
MTSHAPPTRRKFQSDWEQVEYLYNKLLHWFYGEEAPARARPYAERLKRLLRKNDAKQESILGQECRSLIYELEGDLEAAIRHRENEIRKIRRLHEITPKKDWDWVCQRYEYEDLSDRLDLLALLYDANGQTKRALELLGESKALCERHGLPFDGADILEELMADEPSNTAPSAKVNGKHVANGKRKRR